VVYFCPAERVVVVRCRDETDAAYCSVQYPDRRGPETGGMTPELAETRGTVVEEAPVVPAGGAGAAGRRSRPAAPPGPSVAAEALEFQSVATNSEFIENGLLNFSCGLTTAGKAYCWGNNQASQLGNRDRLVSSVPLEVSGGQTFASLTAGSLHACGVTAAGAAWCWGYGDEGQLGDGAAGLGGVVPVAVAGGHAFASLSGGHRYTCGVTTAGAAWCWGSNTLGQFGNGTIADSRVPVLRPHVRRDPGGEARCWGGNGYGTLGDGTNDDSPVPVAVGRP
jgi:hypothetical protein